MAGTSKKPLVAALVYELTSSTGTGAITVSSLALEDTPQYFRGFYDTFGTDQPFYYCIRHQTTLEWETGVGIMTSSTSMTRIRVLTSSNSDALVNFSAGTKDVICDLSAYDHQSELNFFDAHQSISLGFKFGGRNTQNPSVTWDTFGAGANIQTTSNDATTYGIIGACYLETGTTNAGGAGLRASQDNLNGQTGPYGQYVEVGVKTEFVWPSANTGSDLPTASEDYDFFIGFLDNNAVENAVPSDTGNTAVGIFLDSNYSNFQVLGNNGGGTPSYYDTGVAAAQDTNFDMEVVVRSEDIRNNAYAECYINGAHVKTLTNSEAVPNSLLIPYMGYIFKKAGTTEKRVWMRKSCFWERTTRND